MQTKHIFSIKAVMLAGVMGVFFLFSLPSLLAQSNEVIDRLLEQDKAHFNLSAYMVFTAAGKLPEGAELNEVTELISYEALGLTPLSEIEADSPITAGEYSYLLMETLDMKGGIMYRLFPGPRYAARELRFLGFLPGSSAKDRHISGNEVLHILGRALDWKENQ